MKKNFAAVAVIFILAVAGAAVYSAFSRATPGAHEPIQAPGNTVAIQEKVIMAKQIGQETTAANAAIRLIPVIVYHHIGTPRQTMSSADKSFFIEAEWLEKHLQYLQEHGFTTIHFSDIAAYFNDGTPLPEHPVIISFDDGWKNNFTRAFPLLQKYNMTATAFIPTNLVGKGTGPGTLGERMTWDDIAALRDAGWEIGSHTLWHPYLTKTKRAREEIFDSKKALEEKLGITVTTFAYPFGVYNASIEQLVKDAGYTTARSFSTGNGVTKENIFHIPTVRVYANIGLERWKNQLFEGTSPPATTP